MKKLSKVEIARRIRDNGYDCNNVCTYVCTCRECPFFANDSGCIEDEMASYEFKEAVDTYIKRYSRKPVVKKSLITDRPNFRKAIKEKKAFVVNTTDEEVIKKLISISNIPRADINRSLDKFAKDARRRGGMKFVISNDARREYYAFAMTDSHIPITTEYNPTTDTFADVNETDFVDIPENKTEPDPLPEPVSVAEIVNDLPESKFYWYLNESPPKIEKMGIRNHVEFIVFEDKTLGLKFADKVRDVNNIYRTLPDVVKVAESRGWK